MIAMLPRNRFEEVLAANRRLVDHIMKSGDTENAEFRRTCYAAAADALNRFLLDQLGSLSDQQREQLRASLYSAIQEAESAFGNGLSNTAILTSLDSSGWRLAYLENQSVPAESNNQASPSVTRAKMYSWAGWLGAAAFGATATFIAALALHLLGVVHIYSRANSFHQFRSFDAAVTEAAPVVERSMVAIRKIEDRLIAAAKDGSLDQSVIRTKFLPVTEIFPDLATEIRPLLPPSSGLIARLAAGPETGYKILIISEYCSAVHVLDPAKVDPVRVSNPLFCRYYGIWTENARAL